MKKEDIIELIKDSDDNTVYNAIITLIDSIKKRLSWDEYFCLIASAAKQRSSCERLKVGCVIVKNNVILSTGYNGHIPGAPHISRVIDDHEQMTIHAETNAVCSAAKNGVSLEGAKLYVTHFPCINCTKTVLSAGISEIVYMEDYKNSDVSYELLRSKGVKINRINFI